MTFQFKNVTYRKIGSFIFYVNGYIQSLISSAELRVMWFVYMMKKKFILKGFCVRSLWALGDTGSTFSLSRPWFRWDIANVRLTQIFHMTESHYKVYRCICKIQDVAESFGAPSAQDTSDQTIQTSWRLPSKRHGSRTPQQCHRLIASTTHRIDEVIGGRPINWFCRKRYFTNYRYMWKWACIVDNDDGGNTQVQVMSSFTWDGLYFSESYLYII